MPDGLRVIDGGGDDPPLVRRPRDRRCSHNQRFEVSETTRRVYCGDCDQEVDAVDVLLFLVRRRERHVHAAERARAEARRVEARLEDLKREERNARARLRRLQQQEGEFPHPSEIEGGETR